MNMRAARSERPRLALGLMSGTSVDGIDVALVRIAPTKTDNAAHARLENFVTVPFPAPCASKCCVSPKARASRPAKSAS